jgi:hypothetical protein
MVLVACEKIIYNQTLCNELIGDIFIFWKKPQEIVVLVVNFEMLNWKTGHVRYHWTVFIQKKNFY